MKKISLVTALAVAFCATNANAAGYQLNEFSATGLGRSFAGMGVVGDDYSALAYNPAGMTLVKRSGVQAGVTMTEVASKVKGFGNTEGQKTDMDFAIPLPSIFGQYNVNDKLFVGGGIYVPFGLATRYKNDSYIAQSPTGVRHSELEVIDFNLSGAYKFDNGLSLGASAILRRIEGALTSNIHIPYGNRLMKNVAYNDFKVSGWSTTFNLGAMYEFNENSRIGLAYKFKSTQRTRGNHDITVNSAYLDMAQALGLSNFNRFDSVSEPELPASWVLSGYHKFAEKWGTSFSVKYTQWHRFYTFPARSNAPLKGGNFDGDYRWKDAWSFHLGQDYYLNENWTLRAGIAWDETPVPSSSFRSNRIPDADRIWTSVGASYMTGNHQVDVGFAHLFMMSAKTKDMTGGDANAEYDSYSNMFALQYQYKF